jgi:hypothetical protein
MNIQCGYLPGTNSSCYHPIQNVKFWGKNWKTCKVILGETTIYTIINNQQSYLVEQTSNDQYKIELKINGQKIYEYNYLYFVNLVFDQTPQYELEKSMIVDH